MNLPALFFQAVGSPSYFRDPCAVRLRTPRLPDLIPLALLAFVVAACSGCTRAPAAEEVSKNLRTTVATFGNGSTLVRDERLLEKKTVTSFYETRKFGRAWDLGSGDADRVVEAIRGVERDGLDPKDYHLEAIETLIQQRKEGANAELDAQLDLLLTDAVAAMVDDVRYGRVRPAALNPKWNVNPREGAPPLEKELASIAGSRDIKQELESRRHHHFIYQGLVEALGRLRTIATNGGWPNVPAGKSIKPGATDPRIPAIRARLAATGECRRLEPVVDPLRCHAAQGGRAVPGAPSAGHDRGDRQGDDRRDERERGRPGRSGAGKSRDEPGGSSAGWTDDFLLVNLPAFKAYLIRGGTNVWEARTMIGQEARQTPSFRAKMQTVVFNPDWTVPPTILEEDVIKGIHEGRDMIAEKQLTILDSNGNEVDPGSIDWDSADPANFPYTLRQPPGDGNALGRLKFEFPNPYLIYLHDTPSKELFESDKRTFSSGCIRIENPVELADVLLRDQGWDRRRIQEMIDAGETQRVGIETRSRCSSCTGR